MSTKLMLFFVGVSLGLMGSAVMPLFAQECWLLLTADNSKWILFAALMMTYASGWTVSRALT